MVTDARRKRWVQIFASLASEARLRIVEMLTEGDLQCQEIRGEIELSQPAISYHLTKLERAGVLVKEKRGTRTCYRLASDLSLLIKMLRQEEKR
jgi:DNA-binding transcriptional ArsR family regulator